jgi:hypothetical protein
MTGCNPGIPCMLACQTKCFVYLQASYFLGGTTYTVTQKPFITSNHFDVDSFLAVWSYINRSLASQHEPGARHNCTSCTAS